MPDCREQVYSNDYFDFIVPYGVEAEVPVSGGCTQRVTEDFDIFYYSRANLAPLTIERYTYTAIPKCYGLLDTTALEVSGIIRMQNQPALSLKGRGVLVGFIDTGERVIIMSIRDKGNKIRVSSYICFVKKDNVRRRR